MGDRTADRSIAAAFLAAPLLDGLLGTPPVIGANVRGSVGAANWVFLLPTLDIRRAVLVPHDPRTAAALRAAIDGVSVEAVDALAVDAEDPVDLVVVSDAATAGASRDGPRRANGPGANDRLARTLARLGHGAILLSRGPGEDAVASIQTVADGVVVSPPRELRLTVHGGVVQFASPADGPDFAAGHVRVARGDGHRLPLPLPIPSVRSLLRRRGEPTIEAAHIRIAGTAGMQAGPPSYLVELARRHGVDLAGWQWAFSATGDYPSQKAVWYLGPPGARSPSIVVKQTRSSRFNQRLEREAAAIAALRSVDLGPDAVLPELVFVGSHGGHAVLAERMIDGRDAPAVMRTGPRARWLATATDWLIRLAAATARPTPPGALDGALTALLDRVDPTYGLSAAERARLRQAIDRLEAAHGRIPTVFAHGDAAIWNLLALGGERVALLDWEGAEPSAPPLLDLFHMLRSFGGLTPKRGVTVTGRWHLVEGSPVTPELAAVVRRYVAALDLPAEVVEDLYHVCWLYRAAKELLRLTPERLQRGQFIRLLRAGLAAPRIAITADLAR